MSLVPIIVGPTAIGKTRLSVEIAELLPVEIVSADSRQIYRLLDIGTAKPPPDLLQKIPHHMINFLRPDEYFSAGMYSKIGRKIIDQILGRGKVPIVVGGSGLYVRALVDGLHRVDVRDDKIRQSLRKRLLVEGVENLYRQLCEIDPVLGKKIQPNDKQRIIRGLEIYLATGKKMSELQEGEQQPASFTPYLIGLTAERKFLYEVINRRVDEMLDEGFLAEAANLKLKGFSTKLNAFNTVGYKEIFSYLDEQITYDEMILLIKRNSRRYAKRQMTWFRNETRIQWYTIDESTDYTQLAKKTVENYHRAFVDIK